jgi:serine/threonine-protein kinase RsbW
VKDVKLPAQINNLPQVVSMVAECALAKNFSASRISEVELAVDEAFTNVCNYAYDSETGEVEVRCFIDDENLLVVEIVDRGKLFDPLSLPEPVLSADLDEREVGGLGVYLVRKIADRVDYSRAGDLNILRLSFLDREVQ